MAVIAFAGEEIRNAIQVSSKHRQKYGQFATALLPFSMVVSCSSFGQNFFSLCKLCCDFKLLSSCTCDFKLLSSCTYLMDRKWIFTIQFSSTFQAALLFFRDIAKMCSTCRKKYWDKNLVWIRTERHWLHFVFIYLILSLPYDLVKWSFQSSFMNFPCVFI